MKAAWILKPDRIGSEERIRSMLSGKAVDHVGFYLMARGFCAKNTNLPINSFFLDPRKSFESQVWVKQMFGQDQNLRLSPALGAWEFNGDIKMPRGEDDFLPTVVRYPVRCEEDARNLKLPDVTTAGWTPLAMEFSTLQNRAGFMTTVRSGTPLTIAEQACGTELLRLWMVKKCPVVHRILEMVTEFCIKLTQYWVKTFGGENVEPQIGASKEATLVTSPEAFREYVLPYTKELYKQISAMGVKQIFTHLCGDQNSNLPYWREISFGNPGSVSVGHEVDLLTAIKHLGESCIIVGNVNPEVLRTGTPQEVYELSKQCLEKGKKAPRGFILAPGCELHTLSPSCNVWSMKKAINDFGWYVS
jgi:uroporphyrinogen decarboxylase